MGFKDKIRNNQNAEHATIEDYQRSIQEKYEALRATKQVPLTALAKEIHKVHKSITEVPSPATVEPVKPLVEQEIEVPSFNKTREFEEALEEETVSEDVVEKTAPGISKPVVVPAVKIKKTELKKPPNKKKDKANP